MKNLIILLALMTPIFTLAQQTITWKGGTPGKENAWAEARNWDKNRVPTDTDYVIIKAFNSCSAYSCNANQPIISGQVTVASVELQAGGQLYISETGELIIDGEFTYSEGISIYGGLLVSNGKIILKDVEQKYLKDCEPVALSQEILYYSTRYDFQFSVVTSQ